MNEEFIAEIDSYNGSKFKVTYIYTEGTFFITEIHLVSSDKSIRELLDDDVVNNIYLKLEKEIQN